MNSEDDNQPVPQRTSSPSRFLFVSSDGLHHTLKQDVRAHVSRYIRREARSRAAANLQSALTWGHDSAAAVASKSRAMTGKKTERKDDDHPVVFLLPSGSSPDSGYDSAFSNHPQDQVSEPPEETRDRLGPMMLPDDDLRRDLAADGSLYPGAAPTMIFPSQDQHIATQSTAATGYTGGKQAMRPVRQSIFLPTNSAWSAVNSMPLDQFDTLPLPLNHADQKVLLSCEFAISRSNKNTRRSFHLMADKIHNAVQVIPSTVYNVPSSRTINNCRDWAFPLIVKTPMLIYAAMAVVAAGKEARLGLQHSPATLTYKSCHIRTLNEWICNPLKRHSAEVLIGVAALIASEHYRGWSASLALHVQAFSQILRARGGWSSFSDDPRSGWFLFGQVTMWSQAYVASLLGAEDKFPAFRTSIATDIEDILQARDDLLQLLSALILWARRQANTALPDSETQSEYEHYLGEGTLLFRLSHAPDFLGSTHARAVEVEQSHQAFTIIYLVLAKWERIDHLQNFLTFLDELSRQMRVHGIDKSSTNIPLVWLLIRGIDTRPERKIRALELLKVLHVLPPELKARLLKFMLRLLQFDPSSSASVFSFEDLENLDRAVSSTFPLGDCTALTRPSVIRGR